LQWARTHTLMKYSREQRISKKLWKEQKLNQFRRYRIIERTVEWLSSFFTEKDC
jgi:hypothetical protein